MYPQFSDFSIQIKKKKKLYISIYEGREFVCFVLYGFVPWAFGLAM
jgi:hypothetical protein